MSRPLCHSAFARFERRSSLVWLYRHIYFQVANIFQTLQRSSTGRLWNFYKHVKYMDSKIHWQIKHTCGSWRLWFIRLHWDPLMPQRKKTRTGNNQEHNSVFTDRMIWKHLVPDKTTLSLVYGMETQVKHVTWMYLRLFICIILKIVCCCVDGLFVSACLFCFSHVRQLSDHFCPFLYLLVSVNLLNKGPYWIFLNDEIKFMFGIVCFVFSHLWLQLMTLSMWFAHERQGPSPWPLLMWSLRFNDP